MTIRQVVLVAAVVAGAAVIGNAMLGQRQQAGEPSTSAIEAVTSEKVTVQLLKDPVAAPPLTLQTIDGRTLSPDDLRGKVTLINFWATWCPPCRAEIPQLIALQEKYRDQLIVIGVSEDEDSVDVVKRFVAEHQINYPVVMTTPELERAFPGIVSLPTTFVLDRQSRIVQKHIGMLNASTTEYETRALAGLPINASIEYVDPEKPVGLANAAQAKSIPGIDLAGLTPEKRVATLLKLNSEGCTCGCGLTLAKCRIDDPSCGVSLPLARRIASEIAAGTTPPKS